MVFMSIKISSFSAFDLYTGSTPKPVGVKPKSLERKFKVFGPALGCKIDFAACVAPVAAGGAGERRSSFHCEEAKTFESEDVDLLIEELGVWTKEDGQLAGEMRILAAAIILDCVHNKKKALCLPSLELSSLPKIIFSFHWLEGLDLSENELPAFPPAIGNYKDLKYLSIGRNKFTVSPTQLQGLSSDLIVQASDDEYENESFSYMIGSLNNDRDLEDLDSSFLDDLAGDIDFT